MAITVPRCFCLLPLSVILLGSCTSIEKQNQSLDLGFLAFGDSGYHYGYLDDKVYKSPKKTLEEFAAKELQDWLDDYKPREDFVVPPAIYNEEVRSYIDASGMFPVAKAMRAHCATVSCEFSVMLGDNIYPDGPTQGADGKDDRQRFEDIFVAPFGQLGAGNDTYRIYATLGNHDWRTSREAALSEVDFFEKTRPFFMDGLFYRVKPPAGRGQVEIFVIDTEVMLAGAEVREAALNPDGSEKQNTPLDTYDDWIKPHGEAEANMAAWLEESLRNSNARWKFVVGHHPIWASGGSKFEQSKTLRKLILPALCRYADAYFAGHEHTLELHEDSCEMVFGHGRQLPLMQVLSGAAAKQRGVNRNFMAYQDETYPQDHAIWVKDMVWGFAHVQLHEDSATVALFTTPNDGSGEVVEEFSYRFERRSDKSAALIPQ